MYGVRDMMAYVHILNGMGLRVLLMLRIVTHAKHKLQYCTSILTDYRFNEGTTKKRITTNNVMRKNGYFIKLSDDTCVFIKNICFLSNTLQSKMLIVPYLYFPQIM